ncbi:hypothetical protein EVJ58_g8603 [Rhodofomes roseus]|uniref:Uncharacterized protein n=1 Tax=Rhodofomes roseus TaxID=34475 RepID=A0A4Y9Y1W0_9APHY|nr:hypothetical protein EVJ58_g8603 [Rhodofomes roseus]
MCPLERGLYTNSIRAIQAMRLATHAHASHYDQPTHGETLREHNQARMCLRYEFEAAAHVVQVR